MADLDILLREEVDESALARSCDAHDSNHNIVRAVLISLLNL